jgi:hypothetical protein
VYSLLFRHSGFDAGSVQNKPCQYLFLAKAESSDLRDLVLFVASERQDDFRTHALRGCTASKLAMDPHVAALFQPLDQHLQTILGQLLA